MRKKTKKTFSRKWLSPFLKTIFYAMTLILISVSICVIVPSSTPVKPFIISSSSMSPTIPNGSLVFIKLDKKDFEIGNIVTFQHPNKPTENITHRITSKDNQNGAIFYKTKGDANNQNDPWIVSSKNIFGKLVFFIPFLGYYVAIAKTKLGVIFLITLPLIILAILEVKAYFPKILK